MTRRCCFLWIACFFAFAAKAQQRDAGFTGAISIEKKFTKRTSVTFFNLYGLNENGTELGYMILDAGLNYRIDRNFTLGMNYRFGEVRNLQNFYEERQYLYGDIAWAKGWGDFGISLRTRYMTKYYGWGMEDGNNYRASKHYLRNRAAIKYDLDHNNEIFISAEQIFRTDQYDHTENWRYGTGISHRFDQRNRIQFTYTIDRSVNTSRKEIQFISGVTYFYRF